MRRGPRGFYDEPPSPAEQALACALVSLALHGLAVVAVPRPRATSPDAAAVEVTLSLTPRPTGPADGEADAIHAGPPRPARPGGAHAPHNVDALTSGRGGDATGAAEVVFLLPHADDVTLTDAPMNAPGPSEASRLRTAMTRSTPEDRRATPRPDDDAHVAHGAGTLRERRPLATRDPAPGARRAPEASTATDPVPAGVTASALASAPGESRDAPTEPRPATRPDSPGVGVLDAQGTRASEAARTAEGRPAVDRASATTLAEVRDRTRDDVDAELRVSRPIESLVDATRRAGARVGDERGGREGLGAPGTGASRLEGGRARALGSGEGDLEALDTRDARYRRWFLDAQRRIDRGLVFPRARMLAMDQGTTVLRARVRRDGSLDGRPEVLRSSGFADLDAAALDALRGALPFGALPAELAPGRDTVRVTFPIAFSNPMTH